MLRHFVDLVIRRDPRRGRARCRRDHFSVPRESGLGSRTFPRECAGTIRGSRAVRRTEGFAGGSPNRGQALAGGGPDGGWRIPRFFPGNTPTLPGLFPGNVPVRFAGGSPNRGPALAGGGPDGGWRIPPFFPGNTLTFPRLMPPTHTHFLQVELLKKGTPCTPFDCKLFNETHVVVRCVCALQEAE